MLFYLWSNKYSKWFRAGAWGSFHASDVLRYLVAGIDDRAWHAEHDEPKTLALDEYGRWYSLVEYDGETPPTEPAVAPIPASEALLLDEVA